MDSETFSGWNQSIGCALVWVTVARDSESTVTNFLPSYRWRDSVKIVFFESLSVFTEGCDRTNVDHSVCLTSPLHADVLGRL